MEQEDQARDEDREEAMQLGRQLWGLMDLGSARWDSVTAGENTFVEDRTPHLSNQTSSEKVLGIFHKFARQTEEEHQEKTAALFAGHFSLAELTALVERYESDLFAKLVKFKQGPLGDLMADCYDDIEQRATAKLKTMGVLIDTDEEDTISLETIPQQDEASTREIFEICPAKTIG